MSPATISLESQTELIRGVSELLHECLVIVIEQPSLKTKFRYGYESAENISGDNKNTFPTIKIYGVGGRAVVVASCVTNRPPYKAHPHKLVGHGCRDGVCVLEFNSDMTCSFPNLKIQWVKTEDIEESLQLRKKIKVDPFKQGFNHGTWTTGIELNAVRLAFQVFLEGPTVGKYKVPLEPIVSRPIRCYESLLFLKNIATKEFFFPSRTMFF